MKDTPAFEAIAPYRPDNILSLRARKPLSEAIASKYLVATVRKLASVQTEQRLSQIGSGPEIIGVQRHWRHRTARVSIALARPSPCSSFPTTRTACKIDRHLFRIEPADLCASFAYWNGHYYNGRSLRYSPPQFRIAK